LTLWNGEANPVEGLLLYLPRGEESPHRQPGAPSLVGGSRDSVFLDQIVNGYHFVTPLSFLRLAVRLTVALVRFCSTKSLR